MALPNVWNLRTVADDAAKSCYVCYKPSTAVLITPDNKDFFYICRGHLKDKGFCSPKIDEAEVAAKKRREELDKETELIKKEYEEKQKKKKKPAKEGKDGKGKDTSKDAPDEVEKEKDEKIKAINAEAEAETQKIDDLPRIYSLNRNFYQMRVDRIKNMEVAKRNREKFKNPNLFPSVPSGDP